MNSDLPTAGLLGMSGKTAKVIQKSKAAFLTTQTKEYLNKNNTLKKKPMKSPEKQQVDFDNYGKTPKTSRAKSNSNISSDLKQSITKFAASPIRQTEQVASQQ